MDKFLTLADSDRADVFQETAKRMQLHPTPVEKDFWVCYLLRELFNLECVKDHLIFKGGTSLSKCYGIIERFSEDIDLSVHASAFGVEIEDSLTELSKSQRDNRIKTLYRAARLFIEATLIPELNTRLSDQLEGFDWKLELSEVKKDFHILHFAYPKTLSQNQQLHYARPYVQIELSARAEHEPAEERAIQPYIAEHYPQLFDQPQTPLKVLAARRTFWEKATILHAESIRPIEQPMQPRLARHAYDLHQLMQSGIGQAALAEPALLERVAKHKAFFYTQAEVDYEAAYTGGLKVVPEGARLKELAADYKAMRDFFMSEPPDFTDILTSLQTIEQYSNQ